MAEIPLWPERKWGKEHAFIGLLILGLAAFAVLAIWDLHNYLHLAGYFTLIKLKLPAQTKADPDRQMLLGAVFSALNIYRTSRLVLLFSLVVGLVAGLAVVILVARYFLSFRRAEKDLLNAFFALAESIEERDTATGRHCADVGSLAAKLGRRFGMSSVELFYLTLGAQLHDLGKISVPDAILLKPGPLSEVEQVLMRSHAQMGANILGHIHRFAKASEIVHHHHERFDGTGYPDGLAGKEIPLGARIVAVADAFLAMTHNRPYRQAISSLDALKELEREAGHQFDPEVVKYMQSLIPVTEEDPLVQEVW